MRADRDGHAHAASPVGFRPAHDSPKPALGRTWCDTVRPHQVTDQTVRSSSHCLRLRFNCALPHTVRSRPLSEQHQAQAHDEPDKKDDE